MVNITYQYIPPKTVQKDGWTCGYRALKAISKPGEEFDSGSDVSVIKLAILDAGKKNSKSSPASSSGTVLISLEDEKLQKMAALIAQRCGLLEPNLSKMVNDTLGLEKVVNEHEWHDLFAQLVDLKCVQSIFQWLKKQEEAGLFTQAELTSFANFREFNIDEKSSKEFDDSHKKAIREHCEKFSKDNSTKTFHDVDDKKNPLLTDANQTTYPLQEVDVRTWCNDYNTKNAPQKCQASVATRGSEKDPLEEVLQSMKDIFKQKDRQGDETRYFVVNDNQATVNANQGSHWTLLKIVVDTADNVNVTYTDSMHESDKYQMQRYVNEAIHRAWKANQSEAEEVVNRNSNAGSTLFPKPKTPTVKVQTEQQDLQKFKQAFKESLTGNASGSQVSHFRDPKEVPEGVSFTYQYTEAMKSSDKSVASDDSCSTSSVKTDKEVSDSDSDSDSGTSRTKKLVGIIAKPTNQGETFSVAPKSQSQLTGSDQQMACLMQLVLEKHCLLEGKSELDLTIPVRFIGNPVSSVWILEQIEALKTRDGDTKLSDISITVNNTVMVENGAVTSKASAATI